MKKLIIIAIVLGAATIFVPRYVRQLDQKSAQAHAESRVETMLGAWYEGKGQTTTETQTAYCMWYAGRMVLADRHDMDRAIDGFAEWRMQKGLNDAISSYKVVSTTQTSDGVEPEFAVVAQIDGRLFRMRVRHKEPISWL